jgi:hypothetical protein
MMMIELNCDVVDLLCVATKALVPARGGDEAQKIIKKTLKK